MDLDRAWMPRSPVRRTPSFVGASERAPYAERLAAALRGVRTFGPA